LSESNAAWREVGDRTSISERVAAEIQRYIEAERLQPEDRLPSERTLADLLGVSRPSVREGVKFLEARGRLAVRRGQGVFIQRPPLYEGLRQGMSDQQPSFRQLFEVREILEVPAAGWAADIHDVEALAAVARALEELNRAAESEPRDWSLIRELDAKFHMLIVSAAGNPFLNQTLGVLNELMQSGMNTTLPVPGRLEKSRRDHARILAALEAGDVAEAKAATRGHIRAAYRAALAAEGGTASSSSADSGSRFTRVGQG
jgi:GntR family transcriptional regulator, transcriptional repressor for pyruvate dehydrogenase complex